MRTSKIQINKNERQVDEQFLEQMIAFQKS